MTSTHQNSAQSISPFAVKQYPIIADARGGLVVLEGLRDTPFEIKRAYYIFSCSAGAKRGGHAHKTFQQLAIVLNGSCIFEMDDGTRQERIEVQSPNQGILIDRMVWHSMCDFSPGSIILVLASDHYDESDYIRDYVEFKRFTSNYSR